jgi:ribosomal protein S18 acetylase RimI-like enzyme
MTTDPTPAREKVGPGGDPSAQGPAEAPSPAPGPESVVLDCGWGRLVFGNTFPDAERAADALRAEADGARDICVYLAEPHVLVARRHAELFIDPSHTYRLDLPAEIGSRLGSVEVRTLRDADDADAVNRIYAANGMLTAPVDTLVGNAGTDEFLHLVAVHTPTDTVVGTITGVDHVAVFGDPDGGSSLWCLTVDMNAAPPGTGQALLAALADRLVALGRRHVDLSVLADNTGAIRLYERLGFVRIP